MKLFGLGLMAMVGASNISISFSLPKGAADVEGPVVLSNEVPNTVEVTVANAEPLPATISQVRAAFFTPHKKRAKPYGNISTDASAFEVPSGEEVTISIDPIWSLPTWEYEILFNAEARIGEDPVVRVESESQRIKLVDPDYPVWHPKVLVSTVLLGLLIFAIYTTAKAIAPPGFFRGLLPTPLQKFLPEEKAKPTTRKKRE